MSTKITALPASAGLLLTDIFPVVDDPGGVPVTQKATFTQLQSLLGVAGGPFLPLTGGDLSGALTLAGTAISLNVDGSASFGTGTLTVNSVGDVVVSGGGTLQVGTAFIVNAGGGVNISTGALTLDPTGAASFATGVVAISSVGQVDFGSGATSILPDGTANFGFAVTSIDPSGNFNIGGGITSLLVDGSAVFAGAIVTVSAAGVLYVSPSGSLFVENVFEASDSNGIGFFGHAQGGQGVSGADLTNNVTAGGTNDIIANYTDLVIYANDAAAIRNDIYQLARKLKQVNDGLRAVGLLT